MNTLKTHTLSVRRTLAAAGVLLILVLVALSLGGNTDTKASALQPVLIPGAVLLLLAGSLMMLLQVRRLFRALEQEVSARAADRAIHAGSVALLTDRQFYTRSIVESNIEAIIVINTDGLISDVNSQTEMATGYRRDELTGTPFKNYCNDVDNALMSLFRILNEGKVSNVELFIRAKNGAEIAFACNSAVLCDRDQKIIGINISMRDMTIHKKFERLLEENNLELHRSMGIAERANLAKSTFLSNMSHELRTPLNAILGFAQLLDTDEPLPRATQKLSIRQILQGGWYLLDLINEILDLASIESGKVNLSSEKISLFDVMKECHARIEQQALKKRVRLVFPMESSPALYVNADLTRIKQVMINLLSNAIKYNRVGGEVMIRCQMRSDSLIRVCVQDTGHGMTPDQLSHLFEPFNRLGKEGSIEDGTGIGLVVTRQLIQLMHGTIGVESELGRGSTFWFELPTSASAATGSVAPVLAPQPIVMPARIPERNIRQQLLYIEDNPVNLSLIEQLMLTRSDIDLLVASDGTTGLAKAQSALPAVILLDINLPDINGFDLINVLLENPATSNIPVIALSANAMQSDIQKGLQAGCRHYLTKPVKVTELMEKLDETFSYLALRSAATAGLDNVVGEHRKIVYWK